MFKRKIKEVTTKKIKNYKKFLKDRKLKTYNIW